MKRKPIFPGENPVQVNRGSERMQKRFLWGGVAMILVASGFAFLAMARPMGGGPLSPAVARGFPRGSLAPLAAAASFALLAGVLLLPFRAFLKSPEDVAKHRLDGYRAEIAAGV